MTKKELIERLSKYEDDAEVMIINMAIKDDSQGQDCVPAFDIWEATSHNEFMEFDSEIEKRDKDVVFLVINDDTYIRDENIYSLGLELN